MRTVRAHGAGTRPLWTRSWGGAHIVLYSDGLLTCACRLDNIFRSGNIYFGAAIHISERQYIFQNGKTYFQSGSTYFRAAVHIFRAAVHISERQYIFQSSNIYFRAALHISEQQYIF